MWVPLVGMQCHRVAMLQRELFHREFLHRLMKLVRRGSLGHREHDIVDGLGGLSSGSNAAPLLRQMLIEFQIPILEKVGPQALLGESDSLVGFKVDALLKLG